MYRLVKIRYFVLGLAGLLSGGLCLSNAGSSDETSYFFNDVEKDLFCGKSSVNSEGLIKGGFGLKVIEVGCRLPRLQDELVFQGVNRRPDASGQGILLTFRRGRVSSFLSQGKKYFINFKKISRTGTFELEDWDFEINYYFDEQASNAPLWLQVTHISENGLSISVKVGGSFKNRLSGEVVTQIEDFTLCAQRQDGLELEEWFLGKHKVDAAFPMKQKMRRIGKDLFVLMHGGSDYLDCLAKERFDFVCDDLNYCRFLAINDYLVWDGKLWIEPRYFEGKVAEAPILFLKKMDDKAAVFEIWDRGGVRMQLIQLVRYPQASMECEELIKEIDYIGLKTWNGPTILMATGQRFSLKPNDWLLRSSSGWRKLESPGDLEDYLSGKLLEPLFVFNGMEKVDNTYVLKGHLFDSVRAHVLPVTLSLKGRIPTEDSSLQTLSVQQPSYTEINGR